LTKADVPQAAPAEMRRLIEDTFSPNAAVRMAAADKLGALGERGAPSIPFLIRLLDDREPDTSTGSPDAAQGSGQTVGQTAASALVLMGAPALEACVAAAKRPPKPRQIAAIQCLRKFDNDRAIDAILAILDGSADAEIRLAAVSALHGCKDTRVALPLINVLQTDWSRDVRRAAAECFTVLRDPRAVEPLIYSLYFVHSRLYDTAIVALGEQRDQRAVPALLRIVLNNYAAVERRSAAAALGKIGDPQVLPTLTACIKDRYGRPAIQRGHAAEAIGVLGGTDAFDVLAKLFNDDGEPWHVRDSAAQGLAELGDPRAVELLTQVALKREPKQVAFWAAVSVTKLTDGAVDDAGIVRAIRAYSSYVDGVDILDVKKSEALDAIAEHGTGLARFAAGGKPPVWIVVATVTFIAIVMAIPIAVLCVWGWRERQRKGVERK
jgi:HEAT repeat protein